MFLLHSFPFLSTQVLTFELKYISAQTLVSFVPWTMVTNPTPNISYGLGIHWPQLPP